MEVHSSIGPARPAIARELPGERRSSLAPGFTIPYFAPFCYSPRGTSPIAQRSRRLRDLVKSADPAALACCVTRLSALRESRLIPFFLLADETLLVPVPRRVPARPTDLPSAPEVIAGALCRSGIGTALWPGLRRHRPVEKSAWASPGSRPELLAHYTSLELVDPHPPARRLILVDDFITRGRTLLAAAALLSHELEHAEIFAFALVRTEGLQPDIRALTAPTTGLIRYLGGDAFRSP